MADVSLCEKIGQMIMVGFHGTDIDEPEAQATLELAAHKLIGGIILFQYNIQSPEQIQELLSHFQQKGLFIAVDQEGGRVQRLKAHNGFIDTPSAYSISQMPPHEIGHVYGKMAEQLAKAGFNLNFGPVVDIHSDQSPVIGGLERSYSTDPQKIAEYAAIFIKAHSAKSILTTLKHFPGHGLAMKDSHKGLVDVTKTYNDQELKPYKALIQKGLADMIMTAHIVNHEWDREGHPATLSQHVLKPRLRNKLGFKGIIITDDLHMGAIGQHYNLEETVLRAINAGVDVLLFSNNQQAAQGVKNFKSDDTLAHKVIEIIEQSLQKGLLKEERIDESYQRILALKREKGILSYSD